MTRKEWLRRFGEDWRAELPRRIGTLPANVTPLPRRPVLLRFAGCATWAEFMAAYAAERARPPAEVLAFVRPPPESQPAP